MSADPLRIAIVGAGPAGFYAADRLLKSQEPEFEVELFDRLPTPTGLVRAGVAPDHPKIKSVSRAFEKTGRHPRLRYHGNVRVGVELSHEDLLAHHHAVIYAVGASQDRALGIPGEELAGSVAATDFVAWYNGHPDAGEAAYHLDTHRAVVIGNGNVAIDVARMLVLSHDELRRTDIADHALDALEHSAVREVVVLGRRGPAQAAYTTPELLELGKLEDVDVVVDPAEAEPDPASAAWLERDGTPTNRRNVEITRQYAARPPGQASRRIVLRYLRSPTEILGAREVEGVRVVRNELITADDGGLRARPTEEQEVIPAGLVIRSVGYRGRRIEGVPFDERAATIRNQDGRVLGDDGRPVPGVYTAGWIKRGPSGVIGTNKKCANETVDRLLEDVAAGGLPAPTGSPEAFDLLMAQRAPQATDYDAWVRLDSHEREQGEAQGRPRVKVTRMEDMLARAIAAAEER